MFCTFFFIAVPTAIVAYNIFDHYYPGKLKRYGLKASWYVLDLTSRFEIFSENKFKDLKCIIYKAPPPRTAHIKLIRGAIEFGNYDLKHFLETKYDINEPCDFAIYEIPVNNKKYDKYCILYEDYKDIVEIKYNNLCSFNFLNMVRFNFTADSTREIYNLDFGRKQFIIAGNKLFDRKFLKWYLKTNNNVDLGDNEKYTVSFIDHNMLYNTIDENFYIEIKKNTYEIKKLASPASAASPAIENNI